MPFCLTQRPATVEYSGSCQAFGATALQEGVLPGPQTPKFRSAGLGLYGESVWQGQEPRENLVLSTSRGFCKIYHRKPYNPVIRQKWLNKKKKVQGKNTGNPRSGNSPELTTVKGWLHCRPLGNLPRGSMESSRSIYRGPGDGQKCILENFFLLSSGVEKNCWKGTPQPFLGLFF
ncbi:hypothetical protein GWK47_026649 [Chionoecetes opilio]|uniref:Uncharacterized protein n=1 Tax=Chionoecetes opilio TaxID=41210 RepID=A0A8J8WLY3_CHIOP|nr:hypothetical protein GWK47_026649 [Chionoecetes opilio]